MHNATDLIPNAHLDAVPFTGDREGELVTALIDAKAICASFPDEGYVVIITHGFCLLLTSEEWLALVDEQPHVYNVAYMAMDQGAVAFGAPLVDFTAA